MAQLSCQSSSVVFSQNCFCCYIFMFAKVRKFRQYIKLLTAKSFFFPAYCKLAFNLIDVNQVMDLHFNNLWKVICVILPTNMSHITDQYESYYRPIWAILPTNMGHITDQYGPYCRPIYRILPTNIPYITDQYTEYYFAIANSSFHKTLLFIQQKQCFCVLKLTNRHYDK